MRERHGPERDYYTIIKSMFIKTMTTNEFVEATWNERVENGSLEGSRGNGREEGGVVRGSTGQGVGNPAV